MTSLILAQGGTMLAGALGALVVSGLVSSPQGFAQSTSSIKPKFEVASIRPAAQPPSGRRCTGTSTTDAGRVERRCISLVDLLHRTIGIPEYKLAAPDWISQSDQQFDISAKLPDGATQDQIPAMFQSLLEDRFGLVFHRESRERPILALVVAKGGPKVQPAAPESAQPAWVAAAAKIPAASRQFFAPSRTFNFSVQGSDSEQMSIIQSPSMGFVWRSVRRPEGIIRYEAPSITSEGLADLAVVAANLFGLGEEVRDMTGLKGRYQANLEISSAELNAEIRAHPGDFNAQQDSEFRVVQDGLKKLGLQLEPRKAPVELFVIDRLEKTPTEN